MQIGLAAVAIATDRTPQVTCGILVHSLLVGFNHSKRPSAREITDWIGLEKGLQLLEMVSHNGSFQTTNNIFVSNNRIN